MKTSNSSKEFISYAKGNWVNKKVTKKVLDLLNEFVCHSVASDEDFILRGLVRFKIEKTTSTLHPWKVFNKVKAYPASNVLKLSRKKC